MSTNAIQKVFEGDNERYRETAAEQVPHLFASRSSAGGDSGWGLVGVRVTMSWCDDKKGERQGT